MKKTNFDRYLEEQMKDRAFAARFEQAEDARDVRVVIEPEGTSRGRDIARDAISRRANRRKQKRG